jgi:hypothetical protein
MSKNDATNTFLTELRLLAVSILNDRANPFEAFELSILLSKTATLSLLLLRDNLFNGIINF